MLEDFDKQVSDWSESIVRTTSRRRFLYKTVKGAFVTIAGLTLGNFVNLSTAFANGCDCNSTCSGSGTGTFHQYCPSNCVTCVKTDGCFVHTTNLCPWDDGTWIGCSGFGQCGLGYRTCRDCRCTTCSNTCIILSDIICSGCCHPKDVEAEMRRLAHEAKMRQLVDATVSV